jgi:predicted nucleotide-binding protein (sugar kinase/HSP70/actin superfamily)
MKFSIYDSITVTWKKIDKEKKIVAIAGIKLYPNKLKQCLKKRDKTVEEIKEVVNYTNEDQYETHYGEGNDNKGYVVELQIQDGSIRIWCTDWDSKTEKENNWEDDLNVSIERKEFLYWLNNIAY